MQPTPAESSPRAAPLDEGLEIFFGRATQAECRIYARIHHEGLKGARLRGTITGPECVYARTLATSVPLVDRGQGPWLLAEAFLPDPCFWSPALPNLYRAEVELEQRGEIIARASRTVGIRRLGVSGRNLIFDGKRFVIRAVHAEEVPRAPLTAFRDASAALVAADPNDVLCDEASRVGVLVIADISARGNAPGPALRRLARHAAVGIAIIDRESASVVPLREVAPNLLIAERLPMNADVLGAAGTQIAVCDARDPHVLGALTPKLAVPVLAVRRAGGQASVAEARRLCDPLQRHLAPHGDYAGYIV